jgi:hypothetical protein
VPSGCSQILNFSKNDQSKEIPWENARLHFRPQEKIELHILYWTDRWSSYLMGYVLIYRECWHSLLWVYNFRSVGYPKNINLNLWSQQSRRSDTHMHFVNINFRFHSWSLFIYELIFLMDFYVNLSDFSVFYARQIKCRLGICSSNLLTSFHELNFNSLHWMMVGYLTYE